MQTPRAREANGSTFLDREWTTRVIGSLAALLLRSLGATWRVSIEGPNPFDTGPGPHLGAMWHRDILIGCFVFRDKDVGTLVSRSRDGDRIASLLLAMGFRTPTRGSSSRGGAAGLRALMKRVEEGTSVAIQLDGPTGPARIAKIGMVDLASRTGRPISPVAFSARPSFRFRSWDATRLPLPFARVIVHFGAPRRVPAGLTADEEELHRVRLERELDRLASEADSRLGIVDPRPPAT